MYVEIPKAASTTIISWVKALCKYGTYGRNGNFNTLPTTLLSFTVVREPLRRFFSAYGTIRHRVQLKGMKPPHSSKSKANGAYNSATRKAEIERFTKFVSVVVDEGAIVQARNAGSCHWSHVLSQMWFIEMYPQPINLVLHVESLEADINILRRYLPVNLPPEPPTSPQNAAEGSKLPGYLKPSEMIKAAPSAVKMALEYLHQDYVCLQYPKPTLEILLNQSLNASAV